ncbi:MAG TPA: PPC domain-containing protein, partial [Anaerolineae bacterium]
PYCFEEAANYVGAAGSNSSHGTIATPGNNYSGNIADNYTLNWINLPSTGVYSVTLQNTSVGGQLRGSVVCDTGAALNVNALPSIVSAGNSTSLTNFNPAGCSSVVAVVTNQAQTADNPLSCSARSYMLRTDNAGVSPPSTDTFTYLPLVLKLVGTGPACIPSPAGDSDNIADALTVCSGSTVSGQVSGSDLDDVYKIWIAGSKQLTISMNGTGGDADLYLYFPEATNVFTDIPADASTNLDNNEFIQGIATSSGNGQYWYIDVYSFSGTTNYNVTVTLSAPKTSTKTFKLNGTTQPRDRSQPKVSP